MFHFVDEELQVLANKFTTPFDVNNLVFDQGPITVVSHANNGFGSVLIKFMRHVQPSIFMVEVSNIKLLPLYQTLYRSLCFCLVLRNQEAGSSSLPISTTDPPQNNHIFDHRISGVIHLRSYADSAPATSLIWTMILQ